MRRERDSNPRGLGGPCGFQDRSVQPLRHPSAWAHASVGGVTLLVDVEDSDGDHGSHGRPADLRRMHPGVHGGAVLVWAQGRVRTRTPRSGPIGHIQMASGRQARDRTFRRTCPTSRSARRRHSGATQIDGSGGCSALRSRLEAGWMSLVHSRRQALSTRRLQPRNRQPLRRQSRGGIAARSTTRSVRRSSLRAGRRAPRGDRPGTAPQVRQRSSARASDARRSSPTDRDRSL